MSSKSQHIKHKRPLIIIPPSEEFYGEQQSRNDKQHPQEWQTAEERSSSALRKIKSVEQIPHVEGAILATGSKILAFPSSNRYHAHPPTVSPIGAHGQAINISNDLLLPQAKQGSKANIGKPAAYKNQNMEDLIKLLELRDEENIQLMKENEILRSKLERQIHSNKSDAHLDGQNNSRQRPKLKLNSKMIPSYLLSTMAMSTLSNTHASSYTSKIMNNTFRKDKLLSIANLSNKDTVEILSIDRHRTLEDIYKKAKIGATSKKDVSRTYRERLVPSTSSTNLKNVGIPGNQPPLGHQNPYLPNLSSAKNSLHYIEQSSISTNPHHYYPHQAPHYFGQNLNDEDVVSKNFVAENATPNTSTYGTPIQESMEKLTARFTKLLEDYKKKVVNLTKERDNLLAVVQESQQSTKLHQ